MADEPRNSEWEDAVAEAVPAEERRPRTRNMRRPDGTCWGTGRRKSAVARVRVREGTGIFMVNGREYREYFLNKEDTLAVELPLQTSQMGGKVDVLVKVHGGGVSGQAGAVRMGLARALRTMDETLETRLRDAGHLTRDSRMKERKKYGQRGARRRFQFSKR